jgi:hypothetical protein
LSKKSAFLLGEVILCQFLELAAFQSKVVFAVSRNCLVDAIGLLLILFFGLDWRGVSSGVTLLLNLAFEPSDLLLQSRECLCLMIAFHTRLGPGLPQGRTAIMLIGGLLLNDAGYK